ncbi:hypothetical protein [Georgenia alba]|uniref:Uncharacterized protein n=1 Tax=Georgenia alba TaxID=2233858 RepID=A0ABW2QC66_9MICO
MRPVPEPLDPRRYPWGGPPTAPMVVAGDSDPAAAWPPTERLEHLTPVVAVGSNAVEHVLRRKLDGLLDPGVPLSPATAENLGVGHSAHVSAGGYVAAAPFADGGATASVSLGWFDDRQLAALDASEPNYVRRARRVRCVLPDRTVVRAHVYDSRHGVLGRAGRPRHFGPQREVLAWLRRHLPGELGNVERLRAPRARDRLRRAVAAGGLALPSGLST